MTDLRKLDSLIAERVMGWTRIGYKYASGQPLLDCWNTGTEKHSQIPLDSWHPTEDGNDMLRVVERMESRAPLGWRGQFEAQASAAESGGFLAWFWTGEPNYAPTLPLAVCLAALRVVLTAEEFAEVTR